MKSIANLLLLLLATQVHSAETNTPIVNMQTNVGTIVIALNAEKAPVTVANFLSYVNKGFYNGTIFHRVINNFMIQGGGFTKNNQQKETEKPIFNEAYNGLKNVRGTIAMARTFKPHSATAQFFINAKDNPHLDHRGWTWRSWGYAVFGKVTKGMDVVDKIQNAKTDKNGVPLTPIIIEKVFVVKTEK